MKLTIANSNHASVIMPVAQRGAENTCRHVTLVAGSLVHTDFQLLHGRVTQTATLLRLATEPQLHVVFPQSLASSFILIQCNNPIRARYPDYHLNSTPGGSDARASCAQFISLDTSSSSSSAFQRRLAMAMGFFGRFFSLSRLAALYIASHAPRSAP